jgi:AmmeMemoRadiSam system protein A
MMDRAVVFAGVSPHPPVIIPEVGGERLQDVAKTVEGLNRVMQRLVAAEPETVVIISTHTPRDPKSFSGYTGPRLRGDFRQFGAPFTEVDVPNDVILLSRISSVCLEAGISLWMIPASRRLDHGTLVPLHYLLDAGYQSPVVVVGLPFPYVAAEQHLRFGECIAEAAKQLDRRMALIVSGDMSHRLTPDGPYEYSPRAHLYDEQVRAAIANGDLDGILNIDADLKEEAGEDIYQSLLVGLGGIGRQFHRNEVCSYEGPFGVGYLTAVLADYQEPAEESTDNPGGLEAVKLARRAVEEFVSHRQVIELPQPLTGRLAEQAGVFVCLKTRDGELRGCVGTVQPAQKTIVEEIIHNAICAATKDTRFDPVTAKELAGLVYSVDILSPVELISDLTQLDPKRFGLLVESEDGRHGLLLPDLAGIDTVDQQVGLTMKKAGLPPGTPVKLYRFTVERITEQAESK